jgi:hypothetical protein
VGRISLSAECDICQVQTWTWESVKIPITKKLRVLTQKWNSGRYGGTQARPVLVIVPRVISEFTHIVKLQLLLLGHSLQKRMCKCEARPKK